MSAEGREASVRKEEIMHVSKVLSLGVTFALGVAAPTVHAKPKPDVSALTSLGKEVFFDTRLSDPPTQSCASCHAAAAGWTSDDSFINERLVVVPGADPSTSGGRRPPMAAYASFAPSFDADGVGCFVPEGTEATDVIPGVACVGGIFWDGRATGYGIGSEVFELPSCNDSVTAAFTQAYADFLGPTADQALGPFANPVEQGLPIGETELAGAEAVCEGVATSHYAKLYREAWGTDLDCSPEGADLSFKRIAVAISAWEHSREVNQFSSKRDFAIAFDDDHEFPLTYFTEQENLGHDLFYGKAGCSGCHQGVPEGDDLFGDGSEPRQLYSDFAFHNLGIPANWDLVAYDPESPDIGLRMVTNRPEHNGAFRTPILRNLTSGTDKGLSKAYMHNGYFKTLEQVVHFYNTAGVKDQCPVGTPVEVAMADDCWPPPENDGFIGIPFAFGALGLTDEEEAAIVAYLETLNDLSPVEAPTPPRVTHEHQPQKHVVSKKNPVAPKKHVAPKKPTAPKKHVAPQHTLHLRRHGRH